MKKGRSPLFNKQKLLPQKEGVVKFNRTNVRYFDEMNVKYLEGIGFYVKRKKRRV